MTAIYSFLLSLFLSAALVPVLARLAGPLGLVDMPGKRKLHDRPVPRVGGIAILIGVLVTMVVWHPEGGQIDAYLVGAGVIGLFGILDDRIDLDFRAKFAAQVVAALIVVVVGGVLITRLPFTDAPLPVWASVPLTVVAIVGVTNAMNLADGLDGLAGGMSLLSAAALGYLAYLGGDTGVALMGLCLAGATLGFLRYNTRPARVFLGDAGSQFLGFGVAVLAILTVERANTLLSPFVPLLVLAIPVLDTLYVMAVRIAAGRSPFRADRAHLHHRLLDLGLHVDEAVVVIYALQVLMCVLAWFLGYWSDGVALGVFAAFAVALFGGLRLAEHRGLRWSHAADRPSVIRRGIDRLQRQGGLAQVADRVLMVAVPGFFIYGALAAGEIPADIGWLALILVNALIAALLLSAIPSALVERLVAFVVAVTAPFLVEEASSLDGNGRLYVQAFVGLIALAVALRVRFGDRRDFQVNPLDLLVVVLVALVPNLPVVRETGYGIVAIEALVLFYACDLLLAERRTGVDLFRIGLIGSLGIVAVRGLWP